MTYLIIAKIDQQNEHRPSKVMSKQMRIIETQEYGMQPSIASRLTRGFSRKILTTSRSFASGCRP
jgi:hypothetical protein